MLTFWGWLGFVSLSPPVLNTGWEGLSLSVLFWTLIPVALSAHGPIWRVQKCPAEHLLHVLKTWQTPSSWKSPRLKDSYFSLTLARLVWEGNVAVSSSQKAPQGSGSQAGGWHCPSRGALSPVPKLHRWGGTKRQHSTNLPASWHWHVPTQHTDFQNCSFKAPQFSSCPHRELCCPAKDSALSCRNQKLNS